MKTPILLLLLVCSGIIQAQHAYITSVLINSCNGSCGEGDNEIIFGNTGSGSLTVNTTNLQLFYGSTSPASTSYTDALTTNPTTTANLNAAAGCSLFTDAVGSTIPPNSSFLVVKNTICTDALVWSGLCGNAPIYIIYSTDASWSSGGNFGNGTGVNRYFRSTITTTSGTVTRDYVYNLPSTYSNDGAFANWSNAGGSAVLYGDNDCAITPVALPVVMTAFQLNKTAKTIEWEVEGNDLAKAFIIDYSTDGNYFEPIIEVTNIQPEVKSSYTVALPEHLLLQDGYFKMNVVDNDNRMTTYDQVLVWETTVESIFQLQHNLLTNPNGTALKVYNQFGQIMGTLERNEALEIPIHQLVFISNGIETVKLVVE